MNEITKDDLIYKDGFPANIDLRKMIVVQVTKDFQQSVILYSCNLKGKTVRCYLPYDIGEKYCSGIFVL